MVVNTIKPALESAAETKEEVKNAKFPLKSWKKFFIQSNYFCQFDTAISEVRRRHTGPRIKITLKYDQVRNKSQRCVNFKSGLQIHAMEDPRKQTLDKSFVTYQFV